MLSCKRDFIVFLVTFIAGVAGLVRFFDGPLSDSYRTVDVVHLIGSEFCIGIAFFTLGMIVANRAR
jgi:hypothetical protein